MHRLFTICLAAAALTGFAVGRRSKMRTTQAMFHSTLAWKPNRLGLSKGPRELIT